MRVFLLGFICLLLLPGCMLTGKMTKLVSEHYAPKSRLTIPDNISWLTVSTDSLKRINGYCESKYNSFFAVPLLVYTYSQEGIECRVNPKIYVNRIVTDLENKMKEQGAEGKITGKKLELSFTNIPTTFFHRYTSHYVALQLVFNNLYFSIRNNELSNRASTLRLNYVLRDAATNTIIKTGTVDT
ncbi:MAG: hypothetical protein H0W61_05175, partial [Bacteroidetes bacterium]|nr:hypothetical protein [Bacteroidota bacterium]